MPAEFQFRPPQAEGRTVAYVSQAPTDQPFTAYRAVQAWCEENGISVGAMCGRSNPIGLMRGNHEIHKWRNLNAQERDALDGRLAGNYRDGPITMDVAPAREQLAASDVRGEPSSGLLN